MGPMTGRGMGYCGGYDASGWANRGPSPRLYGRGGLGYRGRGGRGRGPGFGRGDGGWGYRHWYHATRSPTVPRRASGQRFARFGYPPAGAYGAPDAPPSREQEVEMLKDEAEWLTEQLDAISRRMGGLS
jgi:hypothetical protein